MRELKNEELVSVSGGECWRTTVTQGGRVISETVTCTNNSFSDFASGFGGVANFGESGAFGSGDGASVFGSGDVGGSTPGETQQAIVDYLNSVDEVPPFTADEIKTIRIGLENENHLCRFGSSAAALGGAGAAYAWAAEQSWGVWTPNLLDDAAIGIFGGVSTIISAAGGLTAWASCT